MDSSFIYFINGSTAVIFALPEFHKIAMRNGSSVVQLVQGSVGAKASDKTSLTTRNISMGMRVNTEKLSSVLSRKEKELRKGGGV